eukprot:TRINITY_DN9177_c0_g1_i8.p1 TRINITY_DN9177_c0_g1~~TRINITY_DN9177_c0_g1_i8.p1  ORF type:complete len:103 (+),score=61.79 TRINITY_DN9177_c0_g1_i8:123-431(+)
MNIAGKVDEKEVREELEKVSKEFGKLNLRKEEDDTTTAVVEVKSKDAAKELIKLHAKKIFGDRVDVDFEEFITEKEPATESSKEEKIKKDLEDEGYDVEIVK